jgi:cytochrome c oxidase assembly factor CtaG
MSWHGWSLEPPVLYVAFAALLYWRGGEGYRRARDWREEASFAAGLVTIVLSLESPIDGYAAQLFWVHMVQHVLLLTVAPPLILLGRPWPRMWRALPLGLRTSVGRSLARSTIAAPLRALSRPWPAWLLFNGTIVGWHIPAAYDATLSSNAVHQLEHAMFFFSGMLFWARVIDPGPLRPRLVWPWRIAYLIGAMTVGFGLALVLVFAPQPFYSHYATLVQRPGGITAETDQQLAGGVMWVLGSISYAVAIVIGFYRWLEPDRTLPGALVAPAPPCPDGPLPVAPVAPHEFLPEAGESPAVTRVPIHT